MSEILQEVSRLLSIRQMTTTPYHPMCNGLVKSFNSTLKRMLKRLCSEQPKQWHQYIDALLFAYREVPQECTDFSPPFVLLHGRAVRDPMNKLRRLWTKEEDESNVQTLYQYVFELMERLGETLKLAREELEKSQSRQKRYFDRKCKRRKLEKGDQVLLLHLRIEKSLSCSGKGPM